MREPLRRFAVIGDIHCEDRVLGQALEHLAGLDLDAVLAVGDIVDGTGDPDRCCELLEQHGVVTVRGNHERWVLTDELRTLPEATLEITERTRAYLGELPASLEMDTVAGRLMLCHGVGNDDMVRLAPDTRGYGLQAALGDLRLRTDLRFVVCGHTHERMVRTIGPFTFLNAGTLHRDWQPCVLLADLEASRVTFLDIAGDGSVSEAESIDIEEPQQPG